MRAPRAQHRLAGMVLITIAAELIKKTKASRRLLKRLCDNYERGASLDAISRRIHTDARSSAVRVAAGPQFELTGDAGAAACGLARSAQRSPQHRYRLIEAIPATSAASVVRITSARKLHRRDHATHGSAAHAPAAIASAAYGTWMLYVCTGRALISSSYERYPFHERTTPRSADTFLSENQYPCW
jgi:hypothetical protein